MVPTLFKITILKLLIAVLLLSWASATALAQQDEQTTATQPTPTTKTEPKPKAVQIPLPAPLTQQYKEDLKHYLPSDKIKPLLAGPDDYLTLITENTHINNKGVAILLPDWQQGATNPKAINFLRTQLPLQGWTTISIQPTSTPENYPSSALKISIQQEENQKTIDDYTLKLAAMINAVISKANEYPGIVMIIAQGNHGAMLVDLLDQSNEQVKITQTPNAVILLSSYVLTNNQLIDETNTAFAKKIAYSEYPILDLYLRYDHAVVVAKAKQRLAWSTKEMKVYYRQRQLNNNATGYYPEQELLTQINSWLKSIGW
ncbi:MAG: DUF3530 family protein [Colwellia sp.]|nr:DUF3530 family protein [Colwellia sp.]